MKNYFFLMLATLLLANVVIAQPFNLKKEIKPVELNLINYNPKEVKKKGRINITKVVQVKDTAYYFVKKLSIYSPIVVSVGVQDPSNPVKVSLHKWNWKGESRPGKQTDEKGYWEEKFNTEGDFGIMVVAPNKPSIYNIYVWVGNETKLKIPAPFTTYSASSGGSGLFSGKNLLIAVAALLLIAVSWFLIKKKKKMKSINGLLLIVFLVPATLFAQLDGALDGGSMGFASDDGSGNGSISQNSAALANIPGEIENAGSAIEHMSNFGTAISNMMDIHDAATDLSGAWNVLDKGECSPDFSQPTSALVPSSCAESAGCDECYAQALEGFNADRQTLARMRCLFMNTKNFTDKAIAFGNSMASLPGGVGMGWIPAKKKIDDAYTNIKATYDRKSRELLASLQKNMMKINACENKFGVKDWYQRFGFMYFEFMQEKYKRPD